MAYYGVYVIEDVPNQVLEAVLRSNEEQTGHGWLWLANDYSTLPGKDEVRQDEAKAATATPIDPGWSSPFIGKTLQECAEHNAQVPLPTDVYSHEVFAVVSSDIKLGELTVCRVWSEEEAEQDRVDAQMQFDDEVEDDDDEEAREMLHDDLFKSCIEPGVQALNVPVQYASEWMGTAYSDQWLDRRDSFAPYASQLDREWYEKNSQAT